MAQPRIALVHDWLVGISGTERVLKALHEQYPTAPIYTLFYKKSFTDHFLPQADIRSSSLQRLYTRLPHQKLLAPFLPTAVEALDLYDFDLVISNAVSYTKGLVLRNYTRLIHYCHSPTRQMWDWQIEYQREARRTPWLATVLFQHFGRIWDLAASSRPDLYIANTINTQKRIKKYYGQQSLVVYPPVDLPVADNIPTKFGDYFLIVSRLVQHKNIELAVRTFNKMGLPLMIIGEGPDERKLRHLANANITFLGYQDEVSLRSYLAGCKAFIMPQEEDFGIAPIEAMGYGKPVLALRRGGALEYIEEGMNGEFFDDPVEEVLAYGLKRLNDHLSSYHPESIKASVQRFSKARFQQEIGYIVQAS